VSVDPVPYIFEDVERQIDLADGDPDRPLVLLLHGTAGTLLDMTAPASGPDNNYDFTAPLGGRVEIGPRVYPGIGVWSCCSLDDKKSVRSWRDVLSQNAFRTAVYSQVDNVGLLARPTSELVAVVRALNQAFPGTPLVLLAHSRGGLLARNFLKTAPKDAAQVRALITLHSPHTGSSLGNVATTVRGIIEGLRSVFGDIVISALGWLLDLADSDAYKEMAVGSQFLTDLANGEGPLKGIDYFTFGGVSVRLTRIRTWLYTADSAVPMWRWPPFDHARFEAEVPGASPVADSLPDVIEELTEGRGDLLTADSRTRLGWATHQTNPINHAEALWDPTLQAQVLQILGTQIPGGETPGGPASFWG
jgi:pimeloyl-ACP methyl ester carboxylesterase